MKKYIIPAALSLAALAFLPSCSSKDAETGSDIPENEGFVEIEISEDLTGDLNICGLQISKHAELNADSRKYSFSVTAKLSQNNQNKILYTLTPKGEPEKVVAQNTTGQFTDIPGLEGDRAYLITATVEGNDAVAPQMIEITGCRAISNKPKMTSAELQALFAKLAEEGDSSPLMSSHEQIAPDYTFKLVGLDEGESKPTSFADIFAKLNFGDWSDVTVSDVAYDKFDRISSITLTVKH